MTKEAYDIELALRFVLLRKLAPAELPASGMPLGEYLTKKMIDLASDKRFGAAEDKKAFTATFDTLASALDGDSFRKYDTTKEHFTGGFSVAAYEVIALGIGSDLKIAKAKSPAEIRKLVTTKVWADTSFLTSTGLSAASRLPTTMGRGRSIFAK